LRRLGQRLIPWRSSPAWFLIIVLGYAAITGAALLASSFFHSPRVGTPAGRLLLGTLLVALVKDPGPLGEEFGWRGFALPRLLDRHSPLGASLRLGLAHAAWHLPLFFIPGMPQAQVSFPLFAVGVFSIAIVDTALYLRTRANLFFAILVHLMANVCGGIALGAHALNFFAAEGIAAVVVAVAGGLRPTEPLATDRAAGPGLRPRGL
jgi:hypothetical protein